MICMVIFPAELARSEASLAVYSSPSTLPAELATAVTLFAAPESSILPAEDAFRAASVPVCVSSALAEEDASHRNKGALTLASMSPEDEPLMTTRFVAVRSGIITCPEELASMFKVTVLIGVLAVMDAALLAFKEYGLLRYTVALSSSSFFKFSLRPSN